MPTYRGEGFTHNAREARNKPTTDNAREARNL